MNSFMAQIKWTHYSPGCRATTHGRNCCSSVPAGVRGVPGKNLFFLFCLPPAAATKDYCATLRFPIPDIDKFIALYENATGRYSRQKIILYLAKAHSGPVSHKQDSVCCSNCSGGVFYTYPVFNVFAYWNGGVCFRIEMPGDPVASW
jgi:hypothetical protein